MPIEWIEDRCDLCGACVGVCHIDTAIDLEPNAIVITETCTSCLKCVKICPVQALEGFS